MYSRDDYVNMVLLYGEARQNSREARRLYQERFPGRRLPSADTFRRVERRLRATGSFHALPPVRDAPVTSGNYEEAVQNAIAYNPHTSSRAIGNELNISHVSVLRILHRHKFHPFHQQLHQELHGDDFQKRIEFSQWILQRVEADADFLMDILFSDESRFHNNGTVNRHNFHYWSVEIPHWIRGARFQVQWGVNVWCGIIGDKIIGPYFFEGNLTGRRYLEFLREDLPLLLEDVPLMTRLRMWFQQDGAPPHWLLAVRNHLHRTYPGRWIGRGGPVTWPARSPDLTPLDFFLWGYLKERVYEQEPEGPNHLRRLITEACRQIPPHMLQQARMSLLHRAQICINAAGGHFEHLLH